MKARKYIQVKDYEWTDIEPVHKIKCCDCGLVHTFIWRHYQGKLQLMAIRDNRATGQVRRRRQ